MTLCRMVGKLQLAIYFLPGVQLQLAISGELDRIRRFCRGYNCNRISIFRGVFCNWRYVSAGGTIAIGDGDLFSGGCFAIGDLFLPGVQLQLAISGEFEIRGKLRGNWVNLEVKLGVIG